MVYPPTKRNLLLIKTVEGQKAKLIRIGTYLEGGLIVQTTSVNAIYLPAGCIHATFTIAGGFLIAKDFTTMNSTKAFSEYIASGMDHFLGKQGQKDCFDWFMKCLGIALVNNRAFEALKAWIHTQDHMQDWANSEQRWGSRARKIWEAFLSTRIHWPMLCPCGSLEEEGSWHAHLKATHLQFLYPKPMETRSKGQN